MKFHELQHIGGVVICLMESDIGFFLQQIQAQSGSELIFHADFLLIHDEVDHFPELNIGNHEFVNFQCHDLDILPVVDLNVLQILILGPVLGFITDAVLGLMCHQCC